MGALVVVLSGISYRPVGTVERKIDSPLLSGYHNRSVVVVGEFSAAAGDYRYFVTGYVVAVGGKDGQRK